MPITISIADDVTRATVDAVIAAFASDPAVAVAHSICRTISGRQSLAARLKHAGCPPHLVHRLGWATSVPAHPTPLRPQVAHAKPTSTPALNHSPGPALDAVTVVPEPVGASPGDRGDVVPVGDSQSGRQRRRSRLQGPESE